MKASKKIDLTKVLGKNISDEGSNLEILSPDGQALGITLKVRGRGAKEVKDIVRKQTTQSAKKQAKGKRKTDVETERDNAEMLQVLIAGGDIFSIGDKDIDPSKLTIEEALLISNEFSFISEQVIDFSIDATNFYEKLAGN